MRGGLWNLIICLVMPIEMSFQGIEICKILFIWIVFNICHLTCTKKFGYLPYFQFFILFCWFCLCNILFCWFCLCNIIYLNINILSCGRIRQIFFFFQTIKKYLFLPNKIRYLFFCQLINLIVIYLLFDFLTSFIVTGFCKGNARRIRLFSYRVINNL